MEACAAMLNRRRPDATCRARSVAALATAAALSLLGITTELSGSGGSSVLLRLASKKGSATKAEAVPCGDGAGGACAPARHVYLLKTHKCASTTLQRAIIAHALAHNLSLALPRGGRAHYWPQPFAIESTKRTAAYPHFDVMAVHARHSPLARRLLPADARHVTIVRDPAEQLRSLYDYMRVGPDCLGGMPFDEFVLALGGRRGDLRRVATRVVRCRPAFDLNMQLHDLGHRVSLSTTTEWVSARIAELDAEFDFVAVAELYDASCVLLADLLRWPLDDFAASPRLNARARPPPPMSDDVRAAAYRWNWADKMLYDHFRAKLERLISERAALLDGALPMLASSRREWYDYCVNGTMAIAPTTPPPPVGSAATAAPSPELIGYVLTEAGRRNWSCLIKTMPESELMEVAHAVWPEVTIDGPPA